MSWFSDMLKATSSGYRPTSAPSHNSTYNSQVPHAAAYAALRTLPARSSSSSYNQQVPVANKPNYTYTPPNTTRSVTPSSTYAEQVPTAGQREAGYSPSSGQTWWEDNNPGYKPPGTSGNRGSSGGGGGGSSGGGGGGGSGSGGGGSDGGLPAKPIAHPVIHSLRPTAPTEPAPVKPAVDETWDVLTVPDPMASASYQQDINNLDTSLKNFNSQQGTEKDAKVKAYGRTLKDLGWNVSGKGKDEKDDLDDTGDWQLRGGGGSFANSFLANENDFGSRGASTSGIYQDAIASMLNDYNRRKTDMVDERQDWQQGQDTKKTQFEDADQSNRLTARSEAIAKLAQKYGIEDSMIGFGTGDEGTSFKRRTDSKADKDQVKWVRTGYDQKGLDKHIADTVPGLDDYATKKAKYDEDQAAYKRRVKNWDAHYG